MSDLYPPMELQTKRFGPEAVRFMRAELAKSIRLGRYISELPLESGSTWALIPPGNPPGLVENLRSGLAGPPNEEEYLVPFLCEALGAPSEGVRRLLVFEDTVARRGHQGIGPPQGPEVFCGETPYPMADSTASRDQLIKILASVAGFPGIGVITQLPRSQPVAPGDDVTEETIEKIALNALIVLVMAWDGERFLVWEKPSRSS